MKHIVGIGNPLLDLVAHVDEPFLKKYEAKLSQVILAEKKT